MAQSPFYKGYVAVWRPGTGARPYASGYKLDQFIQLIDAYAGSGFRLISVDYYGPDGTHGGVWAPGTGAQAWSYKNIGRIKLEDIRHFKKKRRIVAIDRNDDKLSVTWRSGVGTGAQYWVTGKTWSEFVSADKNYIDMGLRITHFIKVDGKFTAVWRPGTGEQRVEAGKTAVQFQALNDAYKKRGLRVQSLDMNSGKFYVVWRPGTGGQKTRWGITADQLKKDNAKYVKQGYRLISLRAKRFRKG